jgi:lipopolysaccharide biosynthesis regulator YciM/TolB-like protein
MNEPDRQSNLLRELTRRRVFRSAGAYIVVAWVAVQVGDVIFPEFGAPEWAMRALIIIFLAGFPPAMLLAWTLDFSAGGVTRTPESSYSRTAGFWPKLAMVAVSALMSGAALWLLWDDYIVAIEAPAPVAAIKSRPVIAVQEPRQQLGASSNEWLGDGIANLIRSELTESRHAVVVSRSRWAELVSSADAEEVTLGVARDIGIDYLISGEYFETPDGIVLLLHLEDVDNGTELASPRITGGDVDAILAAVPQLAIEIKRSLRIPHEERVGIFEADFAVSNVAAYEAYIAGLAYLVDFGYENAERAFRSALSLAPDFHIARLRLAHLYATTGRSGMAAETLEQIPEDADLSQRLRLYVDGARTYAVADRDPGRAIEIYSELVELYPYEMEAGLLLAEAYWQNYQDAAAIDELRRLNEIHAYDPLSWMGLGERLLDVGQLDEAREVLGRYLEMRPQDAYAWSLLGNLAMLEGRYADAVGHQREALDHRAGFIVARLGLARSQYLQGEVEAALSSWRSIVADVEVAAAYRIDAVFDLAGVYRGLGRFADSLGALESVMPLIREEGLRHAMALSESGIAHMELGNYETAEVLMSEAVERAPSASTSRYQFARGMLELGLERFERLDRIVAGLREAGSAAGDAGNVERMAADFLDGMSALANGDLTSAEQLLSAATGDTDYVYALYELGYAEFNRQAGNTETALELAVQAAQSRDPGDLRLDLELDRARAQLMHAELLAESGRLERAMEIAGQFADRWRGADADRPELARARAVLEIAAAN